MDQKQILVVDDEKNIRLTTAQSLEPLGMPVRTAVNGDDALQVLGVGHFGLVFLDLKMPGMDGLDVLRRIKDKWPKIRVIIITAHGTIQSAVDAMKLGAVDFIQKPFSPGEIREIATQVVEREALDEESATGYGTLLELARRHITDRSFEAAREVTQRAIASDPAQPGAYNLYGALLEIKGDRLEAQKFYRAALDIDPTYKPARANLDRTTSWHKFGQIQLEHEQEQVKSAKEERIGRRCRRSVALSFVDKG
jgi:DNA-binding response OmpR family regulator